MSNNLAFVLKDGAIKLTCWSSKGNDNKNFYSVEIVRLYKEGDEWKESTKFFGTDILKVSALTQEAYSQIRELQQ